VQGVLVVTDHTDELHPEAVYQALLERGIFALPQCEACGRLHYSPRVLCPFCGSDSLGWSELSGDGTVYSTSTITPRGETAYAVVLIDLAEGPRLMSNVVGLPADDVRIGTRVRARIDSRPDGAVPVFEVSDTEAADS
jgi:uncharacterized OB-fold protein